METSVPITYNRAKTAVIQCQSHLLQARMSLKMAMVILERLDDQAARPVQDRARLLGALEGFLCRLEVEERSLVRAWRQERHEPPRESDRSPAFPAPGSPAH